MTAPLIACAQGQQIGTITKAKLARPSRHRSIQSGRSTTKDCMAIRRRTLGQALTEEADRSGAGLGRKGIAHFLGAARNRFFKLEIAGFREWHVPQFLVRRTEQAVGPETQAL